MWDRKKRLMCSPPLNTVRSPHSLPEPRPCLSSQALVCSQASWMLEGRDTFFQRHLSKYGHVVWKRLFSVITLYVQMKKNAYCFSNTNFRLSIVFLSQELEVLGVLWGRGPQSTQ